jgi:hypothetical protein
MLNWQSSCGNVYSYDHWPIEVVFMSWKFLILQAWKRYIQNELSCYICTTHSKTSWYTTLFVKLCSPEAHIPSYEWCLNGATCDCKLSKVVPPLVFLWTHCNWHGTDITLLFYLCREMSQTFQWCGSLWWYQRTFICSKFITKNINLQMIWPNPFYTNGSVESEFVIISSL